MKSREQGSDPIYDRIPDARPVSCETRDQSGAPRRPNARKIWIDLDNTPHIPFFVPIIRELEERGHRVILTARDAFQVCELATQRHLPYRKIGRHYGKNLALKVFGWIWRAAELAPFALREKPALAVSHGSRSQALIGNLLGIPTVIIMDYEHARFPPWSRPKWEIVPEVIAGESLSAKYVLRYPGIKEDVYVPDFSPDPSVRSELGITDADVVVTIRPPATEAHYHNPEGEGLFNDVMALVLEAPETKIILLPRNEKQGRFLMQKNPSWFAQGRTVIPARAVDGLNLIHFSDLVISGGGTMNREAAAMGVPAYSIFRGPLGVLDRFLEAEGRLTMIRSSDTIPKTVKLERREKRTTFESGPRPALQRIIHHIESILAEETRGTRPGKVRPS